ncbi:MAG: hypothetical protein LBL65_06985 [Campylobacteraceae bacterium]|nr:hypothetical protein [Campylobacteraceae bacterium]
MTQSAQDAVKENPKLFEEYNNPNTPIDRKNELDEQITNLIMTGAGYLPVTVFGMNNDIKDESGNSYHGYYDPDTNTIFLNNGYVTTADKSIYVLGHEAGHAIADQQGKVYDTRKLSEENADIVGDYILRASNFALWYNGYDSLSTTSYTNINDITQTINSNNLLFVGMDRGRGEGLVPLLIVAAGVISLSDYANAPGPSDEIYSGPTELIALFPLGAAAGTASKVAIKGADEIVAIGGGTVVKAGKEVVVEAIEAGAKRGLGKLTEKTLTAQELKSIRSYEKLIAEHEKKIIDFKTNPTIRSDMENLSPDIIRAQQVKRIEHLEKEIQTFKNNINKIKSTI